MTVNLGATTLKKHRRATHPMQAYDKLPHPLRHWLANAALPWSPSSCKRIWDNARKRGHSETSALTLLDTIEQKTLAQSTPLAAAG